MSNTINYNINSTMSHKGVELGIPQDWLQVAEARMKNPDDLGKFLKIGILYTGTGNQLLNRYLREHDLYQTEIERIEHDKQFFKSSNLTEDKLWELYNALIDLRIKPPSTDINLYRGLPSSVLDGYKVGDTYHDAGFTSFSFSKNVANRFGTSKKSMIVLTNPEEGVWFSNVGEYEFVVGPRCLFEILNISIESGINVYYVKFIGYNEW